MIRTVLVAKQSYRALVGGVYSIGVVAAQITETEINFAN